MSDRDVICVRILALYVETSTLAGYYVNPRQAARWLDGARFSGRTLTECWRAAVEFRPVCTVEVPVGAN
jgi:hypothetical protein